MLKIEAILDQIDIGSYALPEFQRGYVWNREQVKKLMNSLYRGYPIGGLLTWVTSTDNTITRGDGKLTPGSVNLILDGQQRITSLYGIIKGKAPKFFEGCQNAFTGLYFHLPTETFEFYAPIKMKDDPNWVNVTELYQSGVGEFLEKAPDKEFIVQQLKKLNRIEQIKNVVLNIDQVVGEDKTIDVVVEIFNNVNSGGTKLSKGDLALAKICAQWPEARSEMKTILHRLKKAGYEFELEWLLRCVTVYLTGKPYFSELSAVGTSDFKTGLSEATKLIEIILNQIASRLGLDHDRVLGSRYSIPLMVGYLKKTKAKMLNGMEWNKLLYWYVHTFLWGRYAGSTESVLSQDLNILESGEDVDGLIRQLRMQRGDLTIKPEDFWGWSTGARFYPLLYMLTRTNHAKDWGTGIELSSSLLGKNSTLDLHHIFPKDLLYKAGYSKPLVNALANFAFLTKATNLEISNKNPKEYFELYRKRHPGAVESHWIPLGDPSLLELSNYEEFLRERRELLAENANNFLRSLLVTTDEDVEITDFANRIIEEDSSAKEEEIILRTSIWMEENGLPGGEINYEAIDKNGEYIGMFDLAWPEGIQVGLSQPIALLIDEPEELKSIANQLGYKFFTSENEFMDYVRENYLIE